MEMQLKLHWWLLPLDGDFFDCQNILTMSRVGFGIGLNMMDADISYGYVDNGGSAFLGKSTDVHTTNYVHR